MFIDSHTHGMHAERNSAGKLIQPLMSAWNPGKMTPQEYVKSSLELGIEKIVLLDPTEITFELKKIFGDYVIPVPQVDMDIATPEEIDRLFDRGAVGIKFISPEKSYGHNSYFPLYEIISARRGLAVFHTGYLATEVYEPSGLHCRKTYTDIADMSPAKLDRIARAFPGLKILMAHFGNPWWEEAWKICSSHKNIYADLSGGTSYRRSMDMWAQIFSPDGKLDTATVGKLCFGTDCSYFTCDPNDKKPHQNMIDFHIRLMDRLKVPDELRRKVFRENILMLTELSL
ncbi:MAG: amidohydrolase family protein [Lentisphaerota bacterium]